MDSNETATLESRGPPRQKSVAEELIAEGSCTMRRLCKVLRRPMTDATAMDLLPSSQLKQGGMVARHCMLKKNVTAVSGYRLDVQLSGALRYSQEGALFLSRRVPTHIRRNIPLQSEHGAEPLLAERRL